MTGTVFHRRADQLREEAEVLRRWGQSELAEVADRLADQFEDTWREHQHQELSVAEAAELTGYSEEHLRDLVRRGEIPDLRPEGSKADIRIQRQHLPRKPPSKRRREPVVQGTDPGDKIRRDVAQHHT